MKRRKLQQIQDQKRRENLAYSELAKVGGYLDHVMKLISLQYLTGSMVAMISSEIEVTLERANLKTNKTISIQNALTKATDEYFKHFEGAIRDDAAMDWAEDLDHLETILHDFANIKTLRPKRKAMKEAKEDIESKYNVKLKELE